MLAHRSPRKPYPCRVAPMAFHPQARTSLLHHQRRSFAPLVGFLRMSLASIALLMCLGILPRATAEVPIAPRSAAMFSTAATAASGPPSAAAASAQAPEPRLPFYETWYFYLALLFLGMLLPVQIFRRRMLLMKGRIG